MGTNFKGDVLTFSVNEKAFTSADNMAPQNKDICLLIQDMVTSGYTAGQFQTDDSQAANQAFNLNAMPLITVKEAEEEKKIDQMTMTPAARNADTLQRRRLDITESKSPQQVEEQGSKVLPTSEFAPDPASEVAPDPDPDPNRLNFRVQILSSTKPNTRPEVTVDGKKYATFEYFHKGAYRITVGDFPTVNQANAFRAKCKSAGFNQSFVAAFRGEVRETDPSVFRQQ
jgi:hypothetical protein